jgi:hypothetical protein
MRLIAAACIGLGLATFQLPANAQEILEFTSNYGWEEGDESRSLNAEGLDISISIDSSTINDRLYVRAEFCDDGSGGGTFGMRLTANYPERSHATIRVPEGGCTRWSEHLSDSVPTYYVYIKRHAG